MPARTCLSALALILLAATAEGQGEPLVATAVIDGPRAEVWKAFTTKEGIEAWMLPHASIDLKVGGKMLTHYSKDGKLGDENTIENTILSYDPGRMFSIKATKQPAKFPFKKAIQDMWTVIYFDDAPQGKTRVTVVGLGFTDDAESQKMRAFFKAGNEYTVQRLKKHFEGEGR